MERAPGGGDPTWRGLGCALWRARGPLMGVSPPWGIRAWLIFWFPVLGHGALLRSCLGIS